jgi:membrane protein
MFRTLFRRRNLRRLTIAVWDAMDDRHIGLIAAGVAFYAMLAVFPGLAVLIAVWGWFSDPNLMGAYTGIIEEFVPADALALIEAELHRLVLASSSSLGWATLVSLGVGLWSAWSAVMALIDALNAVHAHAHRPGLMRYAFPVLMTVGLIGLLLSALSVMVLVPTVLVLVPLGPAAAWLLKALPTAVLLTGVLAFLGLFYRWGPNHRVRPSWITPGSILAAVLWGLVSVAFSIYLANFGTYNRIYGSIGAVVAMVMWFYISAYIILLGGIINAELTRIAARGQ